MRLLSLLACAPFFATPIAAQTAFPELQACIAADSASACLLSSFEMCESGAFGDSTNGTRGWCESEVRNLWTDTVAHSLTQTEACLSDTEESNAQSQAQTAWASYQDQHCALMALRDRNGIGGGEDARTFCLASLAAARVDELMQVCGATD